MFQVFDHEQMTKISRSRWRSFFCLRNWVVKLLKFNQSFIVVALILKFLNDLVSFFHIRVHEYNVIVSREIFNHWTILIIHEHFARSTIYQNKNEAHHEKKKKTELSLIVLSSSFLKCREFSESVEVYCWRKRSSSNVERRNCRHFHISFSSWFELKWNSDCIFSSAQLNKEKFMMIIRALLKKKTNERWNFKSLRSLITHALKHLKYSSWIALSANFKCSLKSMKYSSLKTMSISRWWWRKKDINDTSNHLIFVILLIMSFVNRVFHLSINVWTSRWCSFFFHTILSKVFAISFMKFTHSVLKINSLFHWNVFMTIIVDFMSLDEISNDVLKINHMNTL